VSRAQGILEALRVVPDAFADRTALVIGGARGIGEATARVLASCGARVAVLDVVDAGDRVATEIGAAGGEACFVRCDVGHPAELEAAIEAAEAALGPIDVVLHSAAHVRLAPIAELSNDDWDRVHAVNARAAFVAMRRVLPGMLARRRGTVLSLVSLETVPQGTVFNSAKAALRSLMQTAAREIPPDAGVAVFCVLPGVVDTPGFREHMVPCMARLFGVGEDEAMARMAHNPGYTGAIPVDDCAATLAYLMLHGDEYHGQVAELFEPLARHGVIAPPDDWRAPSTAGAPEFMHEFQEMTARARELERRIDLRTRELADEHQRSEGLLLNILPASIAERLKQGPATIADQFDDVTVLFADLVGFTPLSARLPAEVLVTVLDAAFSAFDDIVKGAGLEKIKTIGDCYMVVGGLPEPREDHVAAVARAALQFRAALDGVAARMGLELGCRMGVHTGPVVAGVIGKHKFTICGATP
jgi:NAD(P)-dependent dehydrogenase (short-subunit alcohol dehydrogenase family)/class 3 adenylate cyclase